VCLIVLSIILSACQSDSQRDSKRLNEDKQTLAELNKIATGIKSGQLPNQDIVNSIKKIREKYPYAVEARNVYLMVLTRREDWATAEKVLTEIPENEKTDDDKINLANIYFKQGSYEEVINIVKPLTDSKPNDLNLNILLGKSMFSLGKYDEAQQTFNKIYDALVSNKKFEEISILGNIYFHQGDVKKSIELFNKSLEINPEFFPAMNSLSRAYSATGDENKAEEYRAKTREVYAKLNSNESKKARLVPLYYQLEDAWKEKKYEDVISLVNQVLPEAEEQMKFALYQYLAQANQALGKTQEAQAAMLELQKLQKK
jgi:tetratricopeptide (TPR) repeat protein